MTRNITYRDQLSRVVTSDTVVRLIFQFLPAARRNEGLDQPDEHRQRRQLNDNEGGERLANAEGSLQKTDFDSLGSQLKLVREYKGGKPNVEEAEKLLRFTGLAGDPEMKSLLQARKATGNPITKHTLKVNLSTEADKNLKMVGRLQLPVAAFSAKYASVVKRIKAYTLSFEVRFPEARGRLRRATDGSERSNGVTGV
jgi:hypothetical protein